MSAPDGGNGYWWRSTATAVALLLLVPIGSSYIAGMVANASMSERQASLERATKDRFDRLEASTTAQLAQLNIAVSERNTALSTRLTAYEERLSRVDSTGATTAERLSNLLSTIEQRGEARDKQYQDIQERLTALERGQTDDRVRSARVEAQLDRILALLGDSMGRPSPRR